MVTCCDWAKVTLYAQIIISTILVIVRIIGSSNNTSLYKEKYAVTLQ